MTQPSLKMAVLAILYILLNLNSPNAATFYIAPDGNDNASGTLEKPFASWAQGQTAASAGDTVLFRTGTYTYAKAIGACKSQTDNVNCVTLNKSGTSGKPILYMACPGEKPVFDFFDVKDDCRIRGVYVPGSWIHLKGLELRGVPQNNNRNHESWCIYITGSHNIFELLDTHHNMGPGVIIWGGTGNLVLNCDSHDNFDEHTSNGAGESADGFGAHTNATGEPNVFRGCRAWWNTDDGYDCISNFEVAIFENCWAWFNGYVPGTMKGIGNGNGFKLGGYGMPPTRSPASPPKNIARNCLSFFNRAAGFYQNHHTADNFFYNNTAYKNNPNYNMLGYKNGGDASMGIYKNNIAFGSSVSSNGKGTEAVNNSWNLTPAPAASDFTSIDTAGILGPRKANGDLPDIDFMHLAGDKYIDKGVDVDLPYNGDRIWELLKKA